MNRHPFFRITWHAVNLVLIIGVLGFLYGVVWEYSTRNYLKGFSDAIVPFSSNTEQKVESILAWMRYGPARRTTSDPNSLDRRNPEDTLNYRQLLQVCGTATNAFVNLAYSSGLDARRLLLLDSARLSKHVVVEVRIAGRWVVADPTFHVLFRDLAGRLLTREQLRDPELFRQATHVIPGYPQNYTYESTVHMRLSRIPLVGAYLRKILDWAWPNWEEAINWTLLLERASFALVIASSLLLFFGLAGRLMLSWYGGRRLGIARVRLRDQFKRAGGILLSQPK